MNAINQEEQTPVRRRSFIGDRSSEADVLKMLAQGKSNKEISQALTIGEQTVKTHVSHILDKLGVPSRTQAALYAINTGMVPLQPHE